MIDRRKFLIVTGVATTGVLTGAGAVIGRPSLARAAEIPIRNTDPQRAIIACYSQAGHTARIGKIIAGTIKKEGLAVEFAEIGKADAKKMSNADLLVFGTPVQYMDVPINVRQWLEQLPDLTGIPVASWTTFGGAGDNFYNTACGVLELTAKKNAVPVGLDTFGNMSTFAPTWSALGRSERILGYRHLPNGETYERARKYARTILQNVRAGKALEVDREFSFGGAMTVFNPRWWTKKMINRHEIDEEKCISCYTCAERCPAGAISPDKEEVDRSACVACLGCINNCPADAIAMEYLCMEVYGWKRFCKENNIVIAEPPEADEI